MSSSVSSGFPGASKLLLTIPSTCDLTDDLSIATDKSTGSVDSFSGLLQRMQGGSDDGLRQRKV
jgi:hypothetical protein